MKPGGVLLVLAGAAVLVYALVNADLLALLGWWIFGTAVPQDPNVGMAFTLVIVGGLLVGSGVAVWRKD
jgi:hypothetical protein